MALLSENRIAWTYTDDNGFDWRVAAQKALTDQNKLGGSAAAASVPAKPAYIKMRRITVHDSSSRSRVVPVYSVGAPICTKAATITVNYQGDSHSLTTTANVIPQNHIRSSVTTQSA